MDFDTLTKRALEIRKKYDDLNYSERGVRWDGTQVMAGFVGDVGDLSKIIMAKDGLRAMDDVDGKLSHELSDCLWSLLVIADYYKIDLGAEFMKNMDLLEARIGADIQRKV